jgi:putative ABC transport system permease protein
VSFHHMMVLGEAASLRTLDPKAILISAPCTEPFRQGLSALPGVKLAVCTSTGSSTTNNFHSLILGSNYAEAIVDRGRRAGTELFSATITPDAIRFHGLKPVAGRLLSEASDGNEGSVLINEAAALRLGFPSPSAAVGQQIAWRRDKEGLSSTIVGVFADPGGVHLNPVMLHLGPPPAKAPEGVGVHLAGGDAAATLAAIDRVWTETGGKGVLERASRADMVGERNNLTMRLTQIFFAIVLVGVLVATLGLYGLSAFLAEQRTKEIGVRKAMGASRLDVLRMLLFQFVRPVLIANLIACPLVLIGVVLISQRIEIPFPFPFGPGVFAPVIAGSLALAMMATFAHAWRVTAERPVASLRYE